MKIYFDGCSWTKGAELENPEEERFSKLVCNELGAEETNVAISGGSNDRIVRNLLVDKNIEDYDLAVIQMTLPARTEYYNEGLSTTKRKSSSDQGWIRVNPPHNFSKPFYQRNLIIKWVDKQVKMQHSDFWKHWYSKITNVKYFITKEKIDYLTIRNSRKIPLILLTINQWTKLPFDIQLENGTRNMKHRYGHPNKDYHKLIANQILEFRETLR